MQKFKPLIWISLLVLFLISCASLEDDGVVYPTPTFAIDIDSPSIQEVEIVKLENIIQETAVPFDYSRIEESLEKDRIATIEAIPRINVNIDATVPTNRISPYIYGLTLAEENTVIDVRPTVYSWTGEAAARYNILNDLGWNPGREFFYANESPFPDSAAPTRDFFALSSAIGASSSFLLPTMGWVAKDTSSCSFPDVERGTCTRGFESTCLSGSTRANPSQTSISITAEDVANFVRLIKQEGYEIDFLSLMFEPELWGVIHYDVHPECTTFEEILQTYQTYAAAVRDEAPEAELMGPGTCCWEFYFNSAAGDLDKAKHDNEDFIPWFLQQMQAFDEAAGKRHLDVLEVHYFPQELDNDFDDEVVAEHRLRAYRSLFDPLYPDESYIREPVKLIPRMNDWIDEYYPGTKLAVSAWNFGAPNTFNGAMALAEVLGVYGREELYYATYYPAIERNTPAFYAFQMYTNYDGFGGKFGDLALDVSVDQPDLISVYPSIDSETGNLHIILINKVRQVQQFEVKIDWEGFESTGEGSIHLYSSWNAREVETDPGIVGGATQMGQNQQIIDLPGYSIMHMVLEPVAEQSEELE
ncbi:MAG: glycoside hydrolase family 44 protein [Chloroflexota bacterium]